MSAEVHVARFGDPAAPPLVLLHGFGFSGRCWEDWLPQISADHHVIVPDLPGFGASAAVDSAADFLRRLQPTLPPRAVFVGWSLGAALAVALAEQAPQRVEALMLLGFNPRFEADSDWGCAMPPAQLAEFIALAGDWRRASRRLLALCSSGESADGENLRRRLRAALSGEVSATSAEAGLKFLRDRDWRPTLARLPMPQLCVFGENDALAPAEVGRRLRAMSGRRRVAILRGASHGGLLRRGEVLAGLLRAFVEDLRASQPTPMRRARVAHAFDRASDDYDAAAPLQRDAGRQLLKLLPTPAPSGVWLDLGCGTGAALADLRARAGGARLLAMDLAPGMLKRARDEAVCVCADACAPPLADGSVDLIFSNLMFQWIDAPGRSLARLRRVLRPGGWLVFSTFAAESLWQSRAVWRSVDAEMHVHRFLDAQRWGAEAAAAGFEWWRLSVENRRCNYPDVETLFGGMRKLGAVNGARGAAKGMMTPGRWRRMRERYESLREPQGLPLRWQLLYAALRAPT